MARVECPKCGCKFDVANHDEMHVSAFNDTTDNILGSLIPSKNQKGESKMNFNVTVEPGNNTGNLEAMLKSMLSAEQYKAIKSVLATPEVKTIYDNGYVRNAKVGPRWIPAHFNRLDDFNKDCTWGHRGTGWTAGMNFYYSYDYQIKMMIEEFHRLSCLAKTDTITFLEEAMFFDADTVVSVMKQYLKDVNDYIYGLRQKKCKGVPYVTYRSNNIFVSDIYKKIISPVKGLINKVNEACCKKNLSDPDFYEGISQALKNLCKNCYVYVSLPHSTAKNKDWVDSFKGKGAFYATRNMIREFGCKLYCDDGIYEGTAADAKLVELSKRYKGEYYRLLAVYQKTKKMNDFNLKTDLELRK